MTTMFDLTESEPSPVSSNTGAAAAPLEIRFSPRGLLILCLFIQGWFVILHLHLANHTSPGVTLLGQAFDLTREGSIPTSWACLQAIGVGITALLILLLRQRQGIPTSHSTGWVIAAILFITIAIDDAASLHERIGAITSLGMMDNLGYPSYPWHIVVAPGFALGLLLAVYLLWGDLKQVRGGRTLVVVAVACFGLSQCIDFVEGLERMSKLPMEVLSKPLPYWMIVEEVLEMVGTALFWCAFAACLFRATLGIPLVFNAGEDDGAGEKPSAK